MLQLVYINKSCDNWLELSDYINLFYKYMCLKYHVCCIILNKALFNKENKCYDIKDLENIVKIIF